MTNIYRDRIVLTINSYIKDFDLLLDRYKRLTNSVAEITDIENDIVKTYDNLVILSNLLDFNKLPKIYYYHIDISNLIRNFYIYKMSFEAYTKNLKCMRCTK